MKAKYLLVFYTSPRSEGYRELFYLPTGRIGFNEEDKITKGMFKYWRKNHEIDGNYPYLHYFPADRNPIQEDKEMWQYLKVLAVKPLQPTRWFKRMEQINN